MVHNQYNSDVNDFSKKKSNQKMKTRQIWKDTNK